MPTALDFAVQFASRGWYVFPIVAYTKKPFKGFHWKELSTKDTKIIQATANHPLYKNCNWALDIGKSNLSIMDIDISKTRTLNPDRSTYKPPRDGRKSLTDLGVSFDSLLNEHYCVQTPSGGHHFYFHGARASSYDGLGSGIEVRSLNEYVLIPGSMADATGNYVYKEKTPLKQISGLKPLPDWVNLKLGEVTNTAKHPNRDIPVTDFDMEENIQRAIHYLTSAQVSEAIEGQGGDNATYRLACRLRDYGLSEEKNLELLLTYWNDDHAYPPWSLEELTQKVKSAYTYAKDRPGNAALETLFPDTAAIPQTQGIRCAKDINPSNIQPRPWLLGKRYLPGYATVTIAPGGVGKSLLTIIEGLSVCSGIQITFDNVNESGPVWYYNAEDPYDELERRIAAAAIKYNLTGNDIKQFYYTSGYEVPIKLAAYDQRQRPIANTKLIDKLIELIKARNIKLFIVDPFVRCHALKENDNEGIDFVMQIFQRIASITQCAISIIHHTRKKPSSADGYGDMDMSRGASSLVYASRIAHTLYPMSEKEAKIYGVALLERFGYVRRDDAKANLSVITGKELWYRKVSVAVNRDDKETTGVLERADGLIPTLLDHQEKIIIDMVAHHVTPEESRSIFTLAKTLEDSGLTGLKQRALIQKIPKIFELPYYKNGYTWRLDQRKGPKNNVASYIICMKEEGGTDEG